jgi:hypothetical protein
MQDTTHNREDVNVAILQRITGISVEREATEESARLLMASEHQRLLEPEDRWSVKTAAHEAVRVAPNEASHEWRATLRGQHRRDALGTPAAQLHCHMCEERVARQALQLAERANDGVAPPQCPL